MSQLTVAYDRADGAHTRRLMPKRFATQLSEIRLNGDDQIIAIVVDCDLPPESVYNAEFDFTHLESAAAVAWREAEAPPPNLVIVNRTSLHAHLVWLLEDPIHLSTQPDAPRYAHVIQRALTRLIPGADLAYAWQSATMHNPWDEASYDVSSHRVEPYRLHELAACLDLNDEPRVKMSRHLHIVSQLNFQQGSRNQSMHEALLAYVRATLGAGHEITLEGLWREAYRLNARCMPALGDGDLKGLVNSKWRYWGGRAPRDRAAELKRKRESEGRTLALVRTRPMEERRVRARALRASGMTVAEIAEILAIGERTVYRYVAGMTVETLIDVIRTQDIPGEGGVSGHSNAEFSAVSDDAESETFARRANPAWTARQTHQRAISADEHEAICACGCQDRGGGRGFVAAFGMFAVTA